MKRMKRQAIDGKKIFGSHISDKEFYLDYIKNPQN